MAIGGIVLLIDIDGYFRLNYHKLSVVIILVVIGGYWWLFYWWLFYYKILLDILGYIIIN